VRGRILFAAALAVVLLGPAVIGPITPAAAQTTSGLDEARRKANAAAERVHDLEAELGELDDELTRLRSERDAAEAELARLRDQVREVAVERYTHSDGDDPFLLAGDLNEGERARALASFVTQNDADAVDRYAATKHRLGVTTEELEQRQADQEKRLDALQEEEDRLAAELDRLEELEAERVEAERRAAEEAARRANDEAARQRANQLQALQNATAVGRSGGSSGGGGGGGGSVGPPQQVASGAWVCPVQGAKTFRDSWGDPRSGGRAHKGVDIMSPRGTPVVNPVSGNVSTRGDRLGGLSMHVQGDDGNYYYGTHLDSYSGATGHLPAGTVIGYVGDTGNAQGTHLHFEIHIGGYGNPINPYPTVARYC
jgi:murein DD-endopeptidase MepM/ murein hydrolase activator NlpD